MNEDVKQDSVSTETTTPEVVTTEVPKPGEKTDPALLLESLRKEREKTRLEREAREKAESELLALKQTPAETEVYSDEGKALLTRISTLEREINQGKEKEVLSGLQTAYPALKDKQAEFDEFRSNPENAGMRLETAAKAFLVENDLLELPQTRKGLEKPSSGPRVPLKEGMTAEEVDDLRINNYSKYSDLIKKGQLKIS